jgi:hypothetical protein
VGWDIAAISSGNARFEFLFTKSIIRGGGSIREVTASADTQMRLLEKTVLPWPDASDRVISMATSGNAPGQLFITDFTADVRIKSGSHLIYHDNDDGEPWSRHGEFNFLDESDIRDIFLYLRGFGVHLRQAGTGDDLFYHVRFIILGFYGTACPMVLGVHRPEGSKTYERLGFHFTGYYAHKKHLDMTKECCQRVGIGARRELLEAHG